MDKTVKAPAAEKLARGRPSQLPVQDLAMRQPCRARGAPQGMRAAPLVRGRGGNRQAHISVRHDNVLSLSEDHEAASLSARMAWSEPIQES